MSEATAVLVVSYGTSQPSALSALTAIAREIGDAFPSLPLVEAFTSRFLRDTLAQRGGPHISHVSDALEQLAAEGYSQVLVQPTHLLQGSEYQAMVAHMAPFTARLKLCVGTPLLSTCQDVEAVAAALPSCLPSLTPDTGALFLGHGTSHETHQVYAQLEQALHRLGHTHLYVGTLKDGLTPQQTLQRLGQDSPHLTRLYLHPLTVVCGVHALRDMLSGPESWHGQLSAQGLQVEGIPQGLGHCPAIRRLFVAHAQQAAQGLT